MARPLRLCLPGMTYHVFSRCIEKKDMLENDYFKDILLNVISLSQQKYSYELISFEILDNHFHFIIRTLSGGESISKIMQYIKARFSETYNRITNRTGPFWNERFKCTIIELSANPIFYLLWLLWYLAFNPVRKNMVRNPRESRFGSINAYLDETHAGRIKITLHSYFLQLGETFQERIRAFLWFEDAYRRRLAVYF